MAFSEGSPDMAVTSACGDAEMCAVRSLVTLVPLGLRDFFAVVARRGVRRLAVFFVVPSAPDSGEGWFMSSAVFVFLGTAVQWLSDFNSFIVHRLVRKCFLALFTRSGKLRET
jgi:hypothetical protein